MTPTVPEVHITDLSPGNDFINVEYVTTREMKSVPGYFAGIVDTASTDPRYRRRRYLLLQIDGDTLAIEMSNIRRISRSVTPQNITYDPSPPSDAPIT